MSAIQDEIQFGGASGGGEEGGVAGAGSSSGMAGSSSGAGAGAGGGGDDDDVDEAELEAMKARVAEMEAEAAKLREMQAEANHGLPASSSFDEDGVDGSGGQAGAGGMGATDEEKEEVDARSVYVGNVDYGATPEEIQQHFSSCGTINRVTILCDKFTGHPKGYAYVEFADPSLVANAMVMNESLFRGRLIKVTAKRTNLPGMAARGRGRGRGRGRPFRGRGRARGYRGRY